jgi:hypothetical protein
MARLLVNPMLLPATSKYTIFATSVSQSGNLTFVLKANLKLDSDSPLHEGLNRELKTTKK